MELRAFVRAVLDEFEDGERARADRDEDGRRSAFTGGAIARSKHVVFGDNQRDEHVEHQEDRPRSNLLTLRETIDFVAGQRWDSRPPREDRYSAFEANVTLEPRIENSYL